MIWNPTGNLKGPKGDKGDKGDTGDQGPSGASGADWNTNLTGIPANITSWAGIAPSAKQDALGYTTVNKSGDNMTGGLYSTGTFNTTHSFHFFTAGIGNAFIRNSGGMPGLDFAIADNTAYGPGSIRATNLYLNSTTHAMEDLRVHGSVIMPGNGKRVMLFDNNLDTPVIDMGSGYGTGSDRHGWIINRNSAGRLHLVARNQNVELTLGDAVSNSYLTGNFKVQGLIAAGDGNGTESVRVGNDASFWDVNIAHVLGVKSQSNASYGGIKFGDGPVLSRSTPSTLHLGGDGLAFGGPGFGSITLTFQDDQNLGWIHFNENRLGFLQVGNYAWGAWIDWNANWVSQGRFIANSGHFNSGTTDGILSCNNGNLYLRPRGADDAGAQTYVDYHGTLHTHRVNSNGGLYQLSADSAAWVRNPRVFVQATDPGAQASEGDLWFW